MDYQAQEEQGKQAVGCNDTSFQNFGHIELEGLRNTRDLGGMATEDGSCIKEKMLIRSGTLARAGEEDAAILVQDYALKTVVDLRTEEEREARPDPVTFFEGVKFIDIPLLDTETLGITRGEKMDKREMIKAVAQDPVKIMTEVYPKMMLDESSQKGFAAFFKVLLEQEEGSVLWHCSAGKDRVGMSTFLLLTVLGVPKETAVQDYLATNRFIDSSTQEILSAFASFNLPGPIRQSIQVINSADMRFLQSALDAVQTEYGGLETYLRSVIDVSEEMEAALKQKYLV